MADDNLNLGPGYQDSFDRGIGPKYSFGLKIEHSGKPSEYPLLDNLRRSPSQPFLELLQTRGYGSMSEVSDQTLLEIIRGRMLEINRSDPTESLGNDEYFILSGIKEELERKLGIQEG